MNILIGALIFAGYLLLGWGWHFLMLMKFGETYLLPAILDMFCWIVTIPAVLLCEFYLALVDIDMKFLSRGMWKLGEKGIYKTYYVDKNKIIEFYECSDRDRWIIEHLGSQASRMEYMRQITKDCKRKYVVR